MKFTDFLVIIFICLLIGLVFYTFKATVDRIIIQRNCEPIIELQEYNAYLKATIASLSCEIDCNEAIAPWDIQGRISCKANCKLDWFLNTITSTSSIEL